MQGGEDGGAGRAAGRRRWAPRGSRREEDWGRGLIALPHRCALGHHF